MWKMTLVAAHRKQFLTNKGWKDFAGAVQWWVSRMTEAELKAVARDLRDAWVAEGSEIPDVP